MKNSLENLLKKAERLLRERQVCTYWKFPNDMRIGGDQLVFGDPGPCDFMGHTADGRVLLIEAKMCKKPSLAVPSKAGIRGHQWVALRDAHYAGGISLIVWQREERVAIYTFDHAGRAKGHRKSIPWTGGALVEDVPDLLHSHIIGYPKSLR